MQNGSPVTHREFTIYIRNVDQQLAEIKHAIAKLDEKVDRINEDKVPSLQQRVQDLDRQQKTIVAIIGGLSGMLSAIATSIIKAIFS